ncbi:MAG: DNA cytosine methyltransferase [Acidobacteriota bacterium]
MGESEMFLPLTHASVFTGIGLFDKAAEMAGYDNIFSVEIDEFCNKHLEKEFPYVKKYKSITRVDFTQYRHRIDFISGGFPCQPYSQAGERKGDSDERALYGELLRVVDEIRPAGLLGENVFGLLTIDGGKTFENMCSQLENRGYEVQPFIIPASALGAVHRRDRVWILAYSRYWHEKRQDVKRQFEEQVGKKDAFNIKRPVEGCGIGASGYSAGKGLQISKAGEFFKPFYDAQRTDSQIASNAHNGGQKIGKKQAAGDKQYCSTTSHADDCNEFDLCGKSGQITEEISFDCNSSIHDTNSRHTGLQRSEQFSTCQWGGAEDTWANYRIIWRTVRILD